MHMRDFSKINEKRCVVGFNHQIVDWSLSDWMTATAGELGEAANIIKKLNRIRDGMQRNETTKEQYNQRLKAEIADVFIYLDLLSQRAGFELEDAVIETFNAKSRELGLPEEYIIHDR